MSVKSRRQERAAVGRGTSGELSLSLTKTSNAPESCLLPPAPASFLRVRIARLLDRFIFHSLLVVFVLAAVPYGTVEPWWKALFECAMFALALLWIIEGMLSGKWLVRQHRLLIPLLALVVFTVVQTTLPLRSASVSGGLQPISFSPYDTQLFVYHLLALIVASGLLLRYTTTRSRLKSLVYVSIGIGLLSTAFGLLRHAFQAKPGYLLPYLQPDSGEVLGGGGFGQFINHNHFAFLAEMSLGLVLGLMLIRPVRFTRLVWCLAMAIPMWVAVVYSGSRGGLASITGTGSLRGLVDLHRETGARVNKGRKQAGACLAPRPIPGDASCSHCLAYDCDGPGCGLGGWRPTSSSAGRHSK